MRMNYRNSRESANETEENETKLFYVHNDIIFITEHVCIDQKEPLEIIQCCVDVGENLQETVIASR
jgi:hypothetical protein